MLPKHSLKVAAPLFILLVLLNAAIAQFTTARLHSYGIWLQESHEMLNHTTALLLAIVKTDTSVRGYYALGDEAYLTAYHSDSAALTSQIAHMLEHPAQNPNQHIRLEKIRNLSTGWLALMEEVVYLKQHGGAPGRILQLVQRINETLDSLRAVVAEMRAEDEADLHARAAEAARFYRCAVVSQALATLLTLVTLIFLGVLLWRYLASRGRALAESHAANEALLQSEALLRIGGRMAHLGGWNIGVPDNRVSWSEEVFAIHDLPPGNPPPSTAECLDFYAPEWRPVVRQAFNACARDGQPLDAVAEIITAKGRRKWVHIMGQAERDEGGNITRIRGAFHDISNIKRAEENLVQMEFRLRTTLESITDAFYTVDREWRFTYMNRESQRILHRTSEALLGTVIWEEFPFLIGSSIEHHYRAAVASNKSVAFEEYYAPLSFWAEIHAYPSEEGLAVYFKDVTERKRTEAALRESEARFRELAENVREVFYVYDQTTHSLLYVSPAYERLWGRSIEALYANSTEYIEGIHEDDRAKALDSFAHEATEPSTIEYRVVRPDGTTSWISDTSYPLLDEEGRVKRVVGTAGDITQRKQAEANLRASEERYLAQRNALIEITSIEGLESGDLDKIFRQIAEVDARTMNLARVSIWRYSEDRSSIQCVELYDRASNEHSAGAKLSKVQFPGYFEALENDDVIAAHDALSHPATVEFGPSYLTPLGIVSMLDARTQLNGGVDGVLCHEHIGAPRVWSEDEQTFAIAAANVVSLALGEWERKRAEADRETLESQLRQSQKMDAVGRLAGGIAHDYNNMLGVIIGYTELALEGAEPQGRLHQDLMQVYAAAKRSADLTRQLLGFARKQPISPTVLHLNDNIESTLRMIRPLIGEDIHLQWRPQKDLWTVKMDPTQIDQLLANLSLNARDAIGGVGHIILETSNVVLDESYAETHVGLLTGEYVMLAVSDDGCGMDKETLDHIFEPFFTTKPLGEGTGLGLATVYGILKQNGGYVNVYSEPQKGTTFRIYLPRHLDAQRSEEEWKPQHPVARATGTVLLVEDEEALLLSGRRLLESLGYSVLPAITTALALQTAQNHEGTIHLLMTDVIMPEMNGHDLWQHVSALRPGIKCLFVSGYTADLIARHGVLNEGVHFLQKPFSRQDLALKIQQVLQEP